MTTWLGPAGQKERKEKKKRKNNKKLNNKEKIYIDLYILSMIAFDLYRFPMISNDFQKISKAAMPYLGVEPLIVHRKASRSLNNVKGGAF